MHPRAVVDRALLLSSLGIADRETSLILGVPVRTIRHWRQGDRRSTPPHRPRPRRAGDVLDDRAYILGLYTRALDQLGIAWRWARPDVVSVARRAAVAALDAFVGPKR